MSRKFLIIQFGNFGDCLYATTIARQVKFDFPDSHITWAISPRYKSILDLNPDVDFVWEVQPREGHHRDPAWNIFLKEVMSRQKNKEFDEVIFSQTLPYNLFNCTGAIRGTILASYKRTIKVSVNPVLFLSHLEVRNVYQFSLDNRLSDFKKVILFECGATSNQTDVDFQFALGVAERITAINNDVLFILSSPTSFNSINNQIIDASFLSFRENAELINYCDLLVGCSSGITWLSTSSWSKKIPTIQFLKKEYIMYQGLKYDHELWDLDSSDIVELVDFSHKEAIDCVNLALVDFSLCSQKYHQEFRINYYHFQAIIDKALEFYLFNQLFAIAYSFVKHNPHLRKSKLLSIMLNSIFDFVIKKTFRILKWIS